MIRVMLVVLVLLLPATSPATELSPGDLVVGSLGSEPSYVRIDPVSGDRSVISGCIDPTVSPCPGVIGTGLNPAFFEAGIVMDLAGDLLVCIGGDGESPDYVIA